MQTPDNCIPPLADMCVKLSAFEKELLLGKGAAVPRQSSF